MTREQVVTVGNKLALVNRAISQREMLDVIYEKLRAVGMEIDSPVVDAMYITHDDYVSLVSEMIGDTYEWLAWYLNENEVGKAGLIAKINGVETIIDSVDKLMILLLRGKQ